MGNVVRNNIVISTRWKGFELEDTLMFARMQLNSRILNVIIYPSLLRDCKTSKRPKLALEALKAMQRQGVVPNAWARSALMSALTIAGVSEFTCRQGIAISTHAPAVMQPRRLLASRP